MSAALKSLIRRGEAVGPPGVDDAHDLQGRGMGGEPLPEARRLQHGDRGLQKGGGAQVGAVGVLVGDGRGRVDADHAEARPCRRRRLRSGRRCRRRKSGCRSCSWAEFRLRWGRNAKRAKRLSPGRPESRPDRRCGGGCGGRRRAFAATWTVRMPISCGARRLRGSSSNIAAVSGVKAVKGKDRLEGRAFGLGQKACVFNAVDRVEKAVKPARLPAPFRHRARRRWYRRCGGRAGRRWRAARSGSAGRTEKSMSCTSVR